MAAGPGRAGTGAGGTGAAGTVLTAPPRPLPALPSRRPSGTPGSGSGPGIAPVVPLPVSLASPASPAGLGDPGDGQRRRRAAQSRAAIGGIFTELAAQAAIPAAAYAIGEEIDGALCLTETPSGYEVFSAAGGARQEVRRFEDEESAYFYLFGVLAAEAVRTGQLSPQR
jgi:hypothetical protein